MRRLIIAVTALALLLAPASGQPAASAQTTPAPYLKDFANFETGPAPSALASDPTLDILVHSRDRSTWRTLEPMAVEHGAMCEAPPATHAHSGSYDDAVFLCGASGNQHLMTALKAGGYGLIYLTPGALADFSEGETVIRWDMSTLRHSQRDWFDVWVTPFEDAMLAPLQTEWPDLSGLPKRGITMTLGNFSGQSMLRGTRLDNHQGTDLDSCWWCGYESVLTPSASRRDTFELRISKTHVKFWMPQYGITWVDKELATPLDWDKGVVQFGHHSYNPEKDCGTPGVPGCMAGTWHWDNLSISKTAPLTLIPAVERWANPSSPTYTFAQPAPADAYFQMHALATGMEYSTDGGATWAEMGKQASNTHKWGGMRTWRQAIPAGTTSVTLRGQEETGTWEANHAVIMSASTAAAPTPTPPAATPTATTEPTATPVPDPTATPAATPADCLVTVTRGGTVISTWSCQ